MNGCVYRTEDSKCEFYSDYGKGIVSYCNFDDCEEKKPSNADRIRSMTDEELADILARSGASRFYIRGDTEALQDEKWHWLDWLKEG